MRKFEIYKMTKNGIPYFSDGKSTRTEKELREWANEVRNNKGLTDLSPNFTETYDSNDRLRREGYIDDLDSCIEFLEDYNYTINEI